MINRLKWMEEALADTIEMQFCNLDTVCTKELGEAVDMIKDLEKAIYYRTITEAMNAEKAATAHSWKMEESYDRGMDEMKIKESKTKQFSNISQNTSQLPKKHK